MLAMPLDLRLSPANDSAASILSVSATNGVQQLLRVVTDAILENDLNLFDIRNLSGRITLHHHKIRVFSNGYGTNLFLSAQVNSPVQSGNFDGFDRRESGFNQ